MFFMIYILCIGRRNVLHLQFYFDHIDEKCTVQYLFSCNYHCQLLNNDQEQGTSKLDENLKSSIFGIYPSLVVFIWKPL